MAIDVDLDHRVEVFIIIILSFLHLLTCVCIIWAISSPHIPPLPLPLAFKQNLVCSLVLQFCRRKNIKDNKKNMAFC
jgi:hypothetical protein